MIKSLKSRLVRVTLNKAYLPEVDGLRFIAILMVVLFHAYGYFYERFDPAIITSGKSCTLINTLLINGDRGVQLFFVLSGFVLCVPFAHHYINQSPKPDIKRYYLRRLTRLEPPYFIAIILLFVVLLFNKAYSFSFLFPSLLASLVYAHGLIFNHVPYLTVVAWSLEVEIQFYIVAPLLFKILKLHSLQRRLILILGAVIIIVIQQFYKLPFFNLSGQLQFFLMGILLADLYVTDFVVELVNTKRFIVLSLLLLNCISYLPIKTSFYANLLFPFFTIIFFYSVLKNEQIKQWFSYGWIPIIGGMCYSIYLIHYPVISIIGKLMTPYAFGSSYIVNIIIQFSCMLIGVMIASGVFYLLVERPFMSGRWTDLLMKKKSAQNSNTST